MNTQNQRKDALKLALQANATKTAEIIKEENSSLESIIKSAADEIGVDKLVPIILDKYPSWSLGALRYVPGIGKYETALKEKARLVVLPSTHGAGTKAMTAEAPQGLPSIDTLEMYVACGAGYVAYFTMWYFTPPFSNSWIVSNINSGDYKPVCQGETQKCEFFSMTDNPLQEGDTVMLVLAIAGNKDWQPSNIQFTYSSKTLYTGEIDCHGQTLNPSFTWSVKKD